MSSGGAPILGLVSIALLAASVAHLLSADAPLVDLRTLKIPTLGFAMIGSSLIWLVIGAIPFLLPLLFQTVFGWSPVKSGAIVLFLFAGNILIKPTTTAMYTRFGFRNTLLASALCLAMTTLGCSLLTAATPLVLIVLLVLVSGAARSVTMTGYSTLALCDVPSDKMRPANALTTMLSAALRGPRDRRRDRGASARRLDRRACIRRRWRPLCLQLRVSRPDGDRPARRAGRLASAAFRRRGSHSPAALTFTIGEQAVARTGMLVTHFMAWPSTGSASPS